MVKNTLTIRDVYQQIGDFFRTHGAERVVMLSSRTDQSQEGRMAIELAVDYCDKKEGLEQKMKDLWPQIDIQVIFKDDPLMDRDLVKEIEGDGIQI